MLSVFFLNLDIEIRVSISNKGFLGDVKCGNRWLKGYFALWIIRLGACFFVAVKFSAFLRHLTYHFESQYLSEYLRVKKIMSLKRA